VLNYNEIQNLRKRKGIIDFDRLMGLLGFENYDDLKDAHYIWVDSEIQTNNSDKENKWTLSIAVGSKTFCCCGSTPGWLSTNRPESSG